MSDSQPQMPPPLPQQDGQWYYVTGGAQQGPVTDHTLRELASAGTITPQTLVWKAGFKEWVAAARLKGLFPKPSTPPPIPTAEAQQNPQLRVVRPSDNEPSVTPREQAPPKQQAPLPPSDDFEATPLSPEVEICHTTFHADGSLTTCLGFLLSPGTEGINFRAADYEYFRAAGDQVLAITEASSQMAYHFVYLEGCWYQITEQRAASPAPPQPARVTPQTSLAPTGWQAHEIRLRMHHQSLEVPHQRGIVTLLRHGQVQINKKTVTLDDIATKPIKLDAVLIRADLGEINTLYLYNAINNCYFHFLYDELSNEANWSQVFYWQDLIPSQDNTAYQISLAATDYLYAWAQKDGLVRLPSRRLLSPGDAATEGGFTFQYDPQPAHLRVIRNDSPGFAQYGYVPALGKEQGRWFSHSQFGTDPQVLKIFVFT